MAGKSHGGRGGKGERGERPVAGVGLPKEKPEREDAPSWVTGNGILGGPELETC